MNYNNFELNIAKEFIRLFSCCMPIKGACRSAIYDLQRNDIKLIPNALYDLILYFDKLKQDQLILYYGENNKNTTQEYLDFLINNELAFTCSGDEVENFPLIDVSEFHIRQIRYYENIFVHFTSE